MESCIDPSTTPLGLRLSFENVVLIPAPTWQATQQTGFWFELPVSVSGDFVDRMPTVGILALVYDRDRLRDTSRQMNSQRSVKVAGDFTCSTEGTRTNTERDFGRTPQDSTVKTSIIYGTPSSRNRSTAVSRSTVPARVDMGNY